MRAYKVVDDSNQFSSENLMKYFEDSLDSVDDHFPKEKWWPITTENFETCSKISKKILDSNF